MNGKMRMILIGIAATAFVYCGIGVGYNIYQGQQAKAEYAQSVELVKLPNLDVVMDVSFISEPNNRDSSKEDHIETDLSDKQEENLDVGTVQDIETIDTQEEKNESQDIKIQENNFADTIDWSLSPNTLPSDIQGEKQRQSLAQEEEKKLESIVDVYAQELLKTDISALKQENEDVIGWIIIPHTNVSYPLLKGDDNQYYLKHTWNKVKNSSGSIFIDYRCSDTLNDFNTILYGHKMRNEMMFSSLTSYKEQSYYEQHPSVYIVIEKMVRRYDIFSAYEADAVERHSYRLGLNTEKGKKAYINYCCENSVIQSDITPTVEDTIITMSTCTQTGVYDYATRWVVHAVLVYEIKAP